MDAVSSKDGWQWVGKEDAAQILATREQRDSPLSPRTLRARVKKGKLESRIRDGRVEYHVASVASSAATDAESVPNPGGNGSASIADVLTEVRADRDYLRQQNAGLLVSLAAKDDEIKQTRERLDGVLALFATMRQPLPSTAEAVPEPIEQPVPVRRRQPRRWYEFWRSKQVRIGHASL